MLSLHRLIGLLFIVSLLAACGGGRASNNATLRFAFPDTPAARTAAETLQKGYANVAPGVTLNLQPLPAQTYGNDLAMLLKGDQAPDLFISVDSDLPLLKGSGELLDLSDHGVAPSGQSPNILAPWREGDKLFGLPQYAVPQMLFFNRELFDAAGQTYPTNGWTWDEWRAAAKRLSNREKDIFGSASGSWDTIIWNNGGDVLNAPREVRCNC